jgi:opacity protein-like surface antigen
VITDVWFVGDTHYQPVKTPMNLQVTTDMKLQKYAVSSLLVMLLSGATAVAETQGLYFGLTAGQSSVDVPEGDFNADILALFADNNIPATIDGSSVNDTDGSFGLYVGYGFNPYVAFEIGYIDLGEVGQTTSVDTPLGGITASSRFSSSGPTLAVVGSYPFAERFAVHVRGGLYFSDTRSRVRLRDDTGEILLSEGDKASDTDLFAGIGVGWNVSDAYTLRLDYQRFLDVGEDLKEDVDLISISFVFR